MVVGKHIIVDSCEVFRIEKFEFKVTVHNGILSALLKYFTILLLILHGVPTKSLFEILGCLENDSYEMLELKHRFE